MGIGSFRNDLGEGTPVTLRVTGADGGLTRVEVTDPDPRAMPVPARAAAADYDESGRGLALLDAVSLRWGVVRTARRCGASWGTRNARPPYPEGQSPAHAGKMTLASTSSPCKALAAPRASIRFPTGPSGECSLDTGRRGKTCVSS